MLVYFEIYEGVYPALQREKTLKRWQREWKIKAREELNPHWKDLSETLCVSVDPRVGNAKIFVENQAVLARV